MRSITSDYQHAVNQPAQTGLQPERVAQQDASVRNTTLAQSDAGVKDQFVSRKIG
jgi:hypothetical protein